MSLKVVNGEIVSRKTMPRGVSAPTPSQIAERAYDLAIDAAVKSMHARTGDSNNAAIWARDDMVEARNAVLSALRASVINPGPIPWWKK